MQEDTVEQKVNLPKKTISNMLFDIGYVNIFVALSSGVFMTGLLLLFGANNSQIGLITSIPLFAQIIAPLFSFYIDKAKERRRLCLKTLLPVRILWIVIAIVPLLVYYKLLPIPLTIMAIIIAVIAFLSAYGGTVWMAWMADLVPEHQRGFVFGRRMMIGGLVLALVGFAGGRYLDFWKDNQYFGFSSMLGIASIFGIVSFVYLSKLPEVPNQTCTSGDFSFMTLPNKFLEISKNKNYLNLVFFNASIGFVTSLIGVYMTVFMLKEMKLGYTYISILVIAQSFTYLSLTEFWGKLIDKYGCKPIMIVCTRAMIIFPIIVIYAIYNKWILIPMNFMAGIFWCGLELSQFNAILKLAPKKDRAMYIGFNTMVTSIACAVAPIIGGFMIDEIGGAKFNFLFISWGGFQILFLLGGVLRYLPALFLKSIVEPKEEKLEEVVRVIRTTIGAGFINGMGVLINYMILPVQTAQHLIEHLIDHKHEHKTDKDDTGY